MIHFGQCIIGPPGSGKTSYCESMKTYLEGQGRKCEIVNLDPANDELPYKPGVDMKELIKVEDVMEAMKLGPNGALIYCAEYLEENVDWLLRKINSFSKDTYILIDCPGQVELYTHHSSTANVLAKLQQEGCRLTAVHLVDGHYCTDPSKYIAILLTSLSTMINLEMPHINVLSKFDMVDESSLHFDKDYYTHVMDLNYVCDILSDDPFLKRYHKLNQEIAGVVESYGLVGFQTLSIKDKKSMQKVLVEADKGNGWIFGQATEQALQDYQGPQRG